MRKFRKLKPKLRTKKEVAIGFIAFGNYVAGVLIFGPAFSNSEFNLPLFVLGIILFVAFYLLSIYILERKNA